MRVLGDDDKKTRERVSHLSRREQLEALASLRLYGTIKTPGAPSFLSLQEGAFLIGENMLGADSGMGQNKAMVCAKFRSGLKNVGLEMKKANTIADQRGDFVSDKDRTKAERYIKAKVCPQTYDRMKKNVIASGILGDKRGGTKPAEKSRKPKAISQMRSATSASVVYEQIKNAKKAKNTIVQVVHGVHFGRNGNPSTLGGCAVTPNVLDACRKRYLEKEHEQTSREEKRGERDVQKAPRVEAAHDVAREVRAKVLSGGDWSRTFKADQIKTAANIILQPAQKFKTHEPAIAALAAWAATQTQTAPQGLAPQ